MKMDKLFTLTWKKVGTIILAWFLAVILHNAVDAIFHFEEAFFFIMAIFVIPIFFIISIIYTLVIKIRGGKK